MSSLFAELKRSGPISYLVFGTAALSVIAAFAIFLLYRVDADADVRRSVDCRINDGPCTKPVGGAGLSATFDIGPRPVRAMKDLYFRLDLKRDGVPVTDGEVSLNLAMPGMYMGRNKVRLVYKGEGGYEGHGVIVKCPSGLRLWKAEVAVKTPSYGAGEPAGVDYTFVVDN